MTDERDGVSAGRSEEAHSDTWPEVLLTALAELDRLSGGSTTAQRSEIAKRLGFDGRSVSRALKLRGLIAHPENSPHGLHVVTEEGRRWLADPERERRSRSYSAYVSTVNDHLARLALHTNMPVGRWRHVLAKQEDWTELLWPGLRAHAPGWIAPKERHGWIHNLRSSQALAVNLLGPLKLGMPWASALWAPRFDAVVSVEFEYPKNGDPLHEMQGSRRSRTRIDARVDHGEVDSTLIEVKLTEPDFGACGAAAEAANTYRDESCLVPFRSFENLHRTCYLAREAQRDYFLRLARPTSPVEEVRLASYGMDGCPLRGGLYQVVRNLMMVQHLREAEGRRARVLIVAPGPGLHPLLHEHAHGRGRTLREDLRSILKADQQDVLDILDFDTLVRDAQGLGIDAADWASYMTRWYVEPLRAGAIALGAVSPG